MKGARIACAALLVAALAALCPSHCSGDDAAAHRHFRSLREMRQQNVVRQRWDMSCGAASLSTLLTHDLHKPTSESEVVVWILRRTNPVRIQARGGFSLWDLKRFVGSRGYKAEGYGDLTLQELADLHQPAIVPLQLKGYSHFVVFRGITGDRVQYADPAFGNLTMTAARFASLWKGGIAFVVLPHGAAPQLTAADTAAPDAGSLYRNLLDRSIGHPTRLTP